MLELDIILLLTTVTCLFFMDIHGAQRINSNMCVFSDEHVYTYCCRCGGGFAVSEEDTQIRQRDDKVEETEEGRHRGLVVCCDTCSLSVYVICSLDRKT